MIPDLTHRADLARVTELMDEPCTFEELRGCLRDISRVNRLTRAYHPPLDFLTRAIPTRPSAPVRILDLGSGYGDMLRRVERWAAERSIPVSLLGVDLNPNAVRAAREATPSSSKIRFLHGDVRTLPEAQSVDLVLCTLVTHHIPEEGIVDLLRWMDSTTRRGWFICDLHRMAMPYRLFSTLMRGPWWHPFVRLDGLASIRRGFREEDWLRMAASAGIPAPTLRHYRPARLCAERLR